MWMARLRLPALLWPWTFSSRMTGGIVPSDSPGAPPAPALNAPRKGEVKPGATLWGRRMQASEMVRGGHDASGLGDRVGDGPSAIGGTEEEPISHRPTPILVAGKSGEAAANAEQATNVAAVAVGVPSRWCW